MSSITIVFTEGERITVNGRLAAIVRKLLLAREDIGERGAVRVTVHCGKDANDVTVEVPKRF